MFSSAQIFKTVGFLAIVAVLSYLAFLVFAKTNGNLETFEEQEEQDREEDVGKSPNASKSSSRPGADSARRAAREKKEYEMRIYVMKLFETLMKRPATDKEIDRYSVLPSENDVLEAVINDYKLGPAAATPPPVAPSDQKRGEGKITEKKEEAEEEEEERVEATQPTDAKKSGREERTSEYSEPYHSPYQHEENSRKERRATKPVKIPRTIEDEEAIVDAYEDDGGGKCYSGPMPLGRSSSRVCLDRGDLLRRLESLAREASHLYHVVSMY